MAGEINWKMREQGPLIILIQSLRESQQVYEIMNKSI